MRRDDAAPSREDKGKEREVEPQESDIRVRVPMEPGQPVITEEGLAAIASAQEQVVRAPAAPPSAATVVTVTVPVRPALLAPDAAEIADQQAQALVDAFRSGLEIAGVAAESMPRIEVRTAEASPDDTADVLTPTLEVRLAEAGWRKLTIPHAERSTPDTTWIHNAKGVVILPDGIEAGAAGWSEFGAGAVSVSSRDGIVVLTPGREIIQLNLPSSPFQHWLRESTRGGRNPLQPPRVKQLLEHLGQEKRSNIKDVLNPPAPLPKHVHDSLTSKDRKLVLAVAPRNQEERQSYLDQLADDYGIEEQTATDTRSEKLPGGIGGWDDSFERYHYNKYHHPSNSESASGNNEFYSEEVDYSDPHDYTPLIDSMRIGPEIFSSRSTFEGFVVDVQPDQEPSGSAEAEDRQDPTASFAEYIENEGVDASTFYIPDSDLFEPLWYELGYLQDYITPEALAYYSTMFPELNPDEEGYFDVTLAIATLEQILRSLPLE